MRYYDTSFHCRYHSMLDFLIFAIVGYLCGSLSSAIIVCKAFGLPDPRTQGSKNPGATNVMRIGGRKAAYATFIGDCLKGVIPVLLARWLGADDWAIAGAGLGAFLGHLYPLYFGFKGGKGVATLAGVLITISPMIFLVFGVVWLAVIFVSGYVSLGSMLGAGGAAFATLLLNYPKPIIALLILLTGLVIYRHKENIEKLRNGTENHFRKK